MGVVLYKAHNENPYVWSSKWGPQPPVYLSILSVLSSACLRSAYKCGSAIQWWTEVNNLKIDISELQHQVDDGSDIKKNLHKADNLWKSSHSFAFAVMSIWSKKTTFSILSFACIVLTILPASSPLLQRASYIDNFNQVVDTNLNVPTRMALPWNSTGVVDGAGQPLGLTAAFQNIAIDFYLGLPRHLLDGSCNGLYRCNGTVPGVGLDIKCSSNVENISFDSRSPPATVFNVNVSFPGVNNSLMSMSVVSKGDSIVDTQGLCVFPRSSTTCTFAPAEIKYKISTDGSYIFLDPNTTYADDQVQNRTQYQPNDWSDIFLYLSQLYTSSVALSYTINLDAVTDLSMISSGVLSLLLAENSTLPACQRTWDDPTEYILQEIRRLMFLTAIAPRSDTEDRTRRQVKSSDEYQSLRFQSDYKFLALSMIVSALSLLGVFVLSLQWKALNRNVNLSPTTFLNSFDSKRRLQGEGERERLHSTGSKGLRKALSEQLNNFLNN